mmetsp:Transcript_82533/g.266120  ORF Transcript_82533/g.266120 Transcript_82533/m.266120 type:complete len:241 (+) Transcript_82533:1895-2617(+)
MGKWRLGGKAAARGGGLRRPVPCRPPLVALAVHARELARQRPDGLGAHLRGLRPFLVHDRRDLLREQRHLDDGVGLDAQSAQHNPARPPQKVLAPASRVSGLGQSHHTLRRVYLGAPAQACALQQGAVLVLALWPFAHRVADRALRAQSLNVPMLPTTGVDQQAERARAVRDRLLERTLCEERHCLPQGRRGQEDAVLDHGLPRLSIQVQRPPLQANNDACGARPVVLGARAVDAMETHR